MTKNEADILIPLVFLLIGAIATILVPSSRAALFHFAYSTYLLLVEVPKWIIGTIVEVILFVWYDVILPIFLTVMYIIVGLGILALVFLFLHVLFNY